MIEFPNHQQTKNPKLILHVGMPKTGTTSIQQTLFHSLRDPKFQYLGVGLVNASRPLQCLVGDTPVAKHTHPAQGVDPDEMLRKRKEIEGCWERQFVRVRQNGTTPIISAEDCWFMNASELMRLRDLILKQGFHTHVIAYLRPPLAWISSMFHQLIKGGHHSFVDELFGIPGNEANKQQVIELDYQKQLSIFEQVFGSDQLTLRPFDRKKLLHGCVVRDFCQSCGITEAPTKIFHINEALSLDATRFMYCYNRFQRCADARPFWKFRLLLARLQELNGPSLRLHPSSLNNFESFYGKQIAYLNSRYNIDLSHDQDLDGELIKTEDDLFRFSKSSLHWLDLASSANLDSDSNILQRVASQVSSIRPSLTQQLRHSIQSYINPWRLRRANR